MFSVVGANLREPRVGGGAMNRRAFLTAVAVAPVAAALGMKLAEAGGTARYYQLVGRHWDGEFADDTLPWDNRPETCSAPITADGIRAAVKQLKAHEIKGDVVCVRTHDFEYWGETPR